MRPAFLEKDPEKQKELYQKFLAENVVPHATIVERHLLKNGTGFLVGSEVIINDTVFLPLYWILTNFLYLIVNQITWADLAYYGYFSFLIEKFGEPFLKVTPNLKALIERVEKLPNIQKWLEVRPKTDI